MEPEFEDEAIHEQVQCMWTLHLCSTCCLQLSLARLAQLAPPTGSMPPKTLCGDSRQMHGELTTQLSQLHSVCVCVCVCEGGCESMKTHVTCRKHVNHDYRNMSTQHVDTPDS